MSSTRSGTCAADKMIHENNRMKEEIRRTAAEIRHRTNSHHKEVEDIRLRYQTQLAELADERDQVADERDQLKERLKSEFRKKLTHEKKKIEDKYTARLQEQAEALDSLRETLGVESVNKEEMFRNQIGELTDQLRVSQAKLCEAQRLFTVEKEAFQNWCFREKKHELEIISNEHRNALNKLAQDHQIRLDEVQLERRVAVESLEKIRTALEAQLREEKRNRQDVETQMSVSFEDTLRDRNETIAKLKDTHRRTLEYQQTLCEGRIEDAAKLSAAHRKRLEDELGNRLNGMKFTHQNVVESINTDSQRRISELEAALVKSNEKFQKQSCQSDTTHQRIVESLRADFRQKIQDMERFDAANSTKATETIRTLQGENQSLTTQIKAVGDAMNTMKNNTAEIRTKFVDALNLQKNDLDAVITDRDNTIDRLRKDIATVHEECSTKLESLQRTQVSAIHEANSARADKQQAEDLVESLVDKLAKQKTQADELVMRIHQTSERQATELQTLHKKQLREKEMQIQAMDQSMKALKMTEQIKQDDLLQSLNRSTAQAEKKYSNLLVEKSKELKAKEHELEVLATKMQRDRDDFLTKMNSVTQKANRETSSLRASTQVEIDRLENVNRELERTVVKTRQCATDEIGERNVTIRELTEISKIRGKELAETRVRVEQLQHTADAIRNEFANKLNDQAQRNQVTLLETEKTAHARMVSKDAEITLLKKTCDGTVAEFARFQKFRETYEAEKQDWDIKEKSMLVEIQELSEQVAVNPDYEKEARLENKIKKMRDDYLHMSRKDKSDLQDMRQKSNQLEQKLAYVENLLKDKAAEAGLVGTQQEELKASYVKNLNSQKEYIEERDRVIAKRDARISELENLVFDTVKKIIQE